MEDQAGDTGMNQIWSTLLLTAALSLVGGVGYMQGQYSVQSRIMVRIYKPPYPSVFSGDCEFIDINEPDIGMACATTREAAK